MKLNSQAFGLSLGATLSAAFIICAAFVAISPFAAASFFSWWSHYDLTTLARTITIGSFVGGTVLSFIFGWAFGFVMAVVYNRFSEKSVS